MKKDIVGMKVHIKDKESMHFGGWGRVVLFDGEYYHVAMFEDNDCVCIFSRDALKVAKY